MASKNINAIAKEFLVKALKIDKTRRMSPEELEKFSFQSGMSGTANVLGEKNLNSTLKGSFKY